jgi:hypothetical protein
MATAIPVKTGRVLEASSSNAAGATKTGTALDLTTTGRFGGVAVLSITNGATGPTIACDAIIEASHDNSIWIEISRQTAPVTASAVQTFAVPIDPAYLYIRSKFTGNTAQAVTVAAYMHELTSISSS